MFSRSHSGFLRGRCSVWCRLSLSLAVTALSLALALAPHGMALAQDNDEDFDAQTLRASDVPADAPRFTDFPAGRAYQGQPHAADVHSHWRSRLFRTRIREGAQTGPNFAGHYTVVSWGCGTGCLSFAIVDAITGRVFHPSNFGSVDNLNVDFEALEPPEGQLVKFHLDSRLLVVIGGINEEPALRGISYFLWEKARLRRVRFVPKPLEP